MAGLSQNGTAHRTVTSTTDADGKVRFTLAAGATADDLIRAFMRDLDQLGRMVTEADVTIVFRPKGYDGS